MPDTTCRDIPCLTCTWPAQIMKWMPVIRNIMNMPIMPITQVMSKCFAAAFGKPAIEHTVLAFSAAVQQWLRFGVPSFAGSNWIPFVFALIVFVYGGIPFIRMALHDYQPKPGMMTLISWQFLCPCSTASGPRFGLGQAFSGNWSRSSILCCWVTGWRCAAYARPRVH